MVTRRTHRGNAVDMDALINKAPANKPAVGNMGVNAKGDRLGSRGEIIQKNEDRVREQYRTSERKVTRQSLKTPDTTPQEETETIEEPKTAKTAKENVRTKTKKAPKADVAEPEEFDAPAEPLGYKEVEMPSGDIEMVPYYKEEDK